MSKIQAVIGANYGDEGKGLITDYLCSQAIAAGQSCLVILSNGGAQRGHTVETEEGQRFVFHHLGSGSFLGVPTFFSADYLVNPMMFLKDREEFIRLRGGMGAAPVICADPRCRFTTPYDIIVNQILEAQRGEARHGSVGAGIWETVRRYEKGIGLSIADMFRLSRVGQLAYMERVREYAEDRVFRKTGIRPSRSEEWKDIWNSPELICHYLRDFKEMMYMLELKEVQFLSGYDILIIENAQGVLLTQDRFDGTNYTTPSDTGAKEIRRLLDDGLRSFVDTTELYYVSRSYLTRHGAGVFPGECPKDDICPGMWDRTNVPNPWQQTIRYARLREEKLIQRIREDLDDITGDHVHPYLAVTHCNECRPDPEALIKGGIPLLISDGRTRKDVRRYEG